MEGVTWLGHASFMFEDKESGNRIYYLDPFHFPKEKDLTHADIIFVTHAHHDHLSPEDIGLILKKDTIIVATHDSFKTLNLSNEKIEVVPNKEYEIKGFKFQTIPAYNIKQERVAYHPKSNGWVGYIFEINGQKIYHAGDTDFVPEMENLSTINLDIALLPIGGTYTMDVNEAIKAANAIKAKKVSPIHYKNLLGEKSKEAEEKFRNGVSESEVIILEEFK